MLVKHLLLLNRGDGHTLQPGGLVGWIQKCRFWDLPAMSVNPSEATHM